MKLKFVVTLCFIVGFSYGLDANAEVTAVTEAPTTQEKTDAPTSKPTSPTTTAAPTTPSTSPSTPSTSTSTPSTTQPTTLSTTTAPITPSTPPTTPSPSPAPTTSAPPSPSTTPRPIPKMWIVKDPATNVTCILAQMEVVFNVHHIKSEAEPVKISPSTATAVGGHCGSPVQTLRVVWSYQNASSSMELSFNASKTNYHVSAINLTLNYNTSEGVVESNFASGNLSLYETNLNTSYSCASIEMPLLKDGKNENITVNIKLSDLMIEAFRPSNSTKFSASHYCSGEVPDIVPLVVGIALAGLVLVVVIAYLIGRRRSQARGYLSM